MYDTINRNGTNAGYHFTPRKPEDKESFTLYIFRINLQLFQCGIFENNIKKVKTKTENAK